MMSIRSKSLVYKSLFLLTFVLKFNIGFSQCPVILPTVTDTCFYGAQSVTLNATGSSGNFAAYDALVGGNFLGSGNPVNAGLISSTTTLYVAAQEENTSLDFDGVNDRVAIQNYSYNASGMTELTVEAWVKTTSTSAMIIASFDRSEYWRLGIGSTGASSGRVSWNVSTDVGYLDMGGSTFVNDGQWHHVAGTFDAGTARIYVDGVLDATSTLGATWGSGSTRFGFIGVGSEANSFNGSRGPNSFMNGEVDELRVWSEARTVAELSNNMNNCLLGTETNLEIYYKLNDGTGSGTSSDEVSNSDGTLVNMSSATDWIIRNNAFYSCPSCESARVPAIITIDNSNPLSITGAGISPSCVGIPLLDAGSSYSTYLWSTGATTQTINANTEGSYSVEVTNAGCSAKDTVEVSFEGGNAQTAGLLDGGNDRIAINGLFYNSTTISELSVEAWVKTSDAGNQIIASFDRSEYWRLGINGDGAGAGQVSWNLLTSAGILDFGSSTRVDDGKWHHVVGTYNSGLASIYIDGVLDATATRGVTVGSGIVRYGFIGCGSEAPSFNGNRGPNQYFDGEIDELRIWSKALTIAEIRSNMCQNYSGSTTDLVAYFKFNNGSGDIINSEIGSASGQTISINTSSFWANSGAPIGDNSVYLYPASWTGNSLSLASCSGAELTVSDVFGTSLGVQLYLIEGDPSNSTGIDSFAVGNHYYGVFWANNSASANFKATIDYNTHPLVNVNNIQGLAILTREDKTASAFTQENVANNVSTKVIASTLTDRNEIILDAFYYVWTGDTDTDWSVASNWEPAVVPPSEANILIPDVINQPILDIDRIVGSLKIETGATVDLDGNTLDHQTNLIADGLILSNAGGLDFSGTSPQFFISGVEQTVDNITSTNPTSLTLENKSVSLTNTLTVQNGTFNTNDSLILISDAIRTARIDEITGGGSIVGEIEMQRYIDAGETYWRFFSSAVQGVTVADYQGDFITSGYVGSDFPSFPFTSVYTYDEGTGYVGVSNANQVIDQGEGLMVWSGDTITGTDPFVVDYRGVPNQGDINMPVTFTPTDGWNLVGNPYASTIDWDLITGLDKQNLANAIYILNPDTEQYATYISGASANGGSNLIASQQSFWVGAIASSPVLTIKESHKSSVDQAFFKAGSTISSGVHILLSGNNKTDEAVLRHVDGATDNYDSEFDAIKRFASWAEYPHISILNANDEDYTVHSFDKSFQEWSLPIRTIVFQNGDYDLVFNDLSELDVPCIKLEDTYDGQMYDVQDGIPMTFTMSDTTYLPRFILHLGKNYEVEAIEALCNGDFGAVSIGLDSLENGTYDLVTGGTISSGTFNGNLQINSLAAGNYSIAMNGLNNLCQSNQFNFEIIEPLEIVMDVTISPEVYGNDGSIITNVSGGTPGYSYLWSTGDSTSNIEGLNAGIYELILIDNNGCSKGTIFDLLSVLGVDNKEINEGTNFVYYQSENRVSLFGNLDPKYSLLDMTGKVISEFEISKGIEKSNINLPNSLSKGTYILAGINSSFTFIK
ncbi:MAG: LamG-like jellyroll fold domain-containing protein [Crocinitomicaceae bacterium]